ncbi:NineTeen Complex (NTC) component [Yamadazyma tenuis]|uniref:Pre-mRNA-splicing factor CLF1 n=1 Tax=Candida tenuis (strain ATCC 10573 / BCRC 21748 / CBS 615 / JCM 9827 / NBRC 10315 / NRRL Y-1498 / VKM Y-70) TaxID=590646 RepID=G3B9Z4_CANTC|nr:uncharacterized protein CANTEDRAFT_123918 [Yamadazyma tenuis ATCC 10573]EGV61360.1 hypothetical protein CANTEDRAFT_123918 [Yamadazyma tenuis ATCC 10573]WEJ92575.1 NineTeen Complex (NTC) component [Yamadazyma tenuis]
MSSESQITSEKIIADSVSHQIKLEKPQQSIEDLEELQSLQLTKRTEYEQQLNKNRLNYGQWIRYAKWEVEFCNDFKRARSIYERALSVNVEHVPFWINYIKFELSNNNINHARNILDRAVAILPKIDKFWFLYVQTEETLQNYNKVRQLFKSWITWKPPATVWDAYVNFEKRYDETDNIREIFEQYILYFPEGKTWMTWINFELRVGDIQYIRNVLELAVDSILKSNPNDEKLPAIIEKWTRWEFKQKEVERANEIFRFILDKSKFQFDSNQYQLLLHEFTNFESKFGDENSLSVNVQLKRKLKYISSIEKNPQDVDSWWLLLDLLSGDELNEYMKKAISPENAPKDTSKTVVWRRYIFLWIRNSFHQEFTLGNIEAARQVWVECLKVIPKQIMFAKIWIEYSEFEIRNGEDGINKARKVLGRAIGIMKQPKKKIFKHYIDFERKLGEWDRIRKIYEKWFELSLINNFSALKVLLEYIDFEKSLQEYDRCEAIYKLGLQLMEEDLVADKLTPFDFLCISFIDFCKEQFEYPKARKLFEDLLLDHDNVKVWISYANFESSIPNDRQLEEFNTNTDEEFAFELEEDQKSNTRKVFERALSHYKKLEKDEERVIILEAWKSYEQTNGDVESTSSVEKKFPDIVKRTKVVDNINQEYLEYVFPQDKSTIPNLSKFLQNARNWASASNS